MSYQNLTLGQQVTLACMLEVSAPKPGNVHRGADFEDLTFFDFIQSAAAIGPMFDQHHRDRLGTLVFAAIEATRNVVSTNTNLGLVLLMAPIAQAASLNPEGIENVLASLDQEDTRLVYQAIELAGAGGLGQVSEMDINHAPPESLLVAMQQAQQRDLIAAQYSNGFHDLFHFAVPKFKEIQQTGLSQVDAIIRMHLEFMAHFPDSLIARKCGQAIAQESADRASNVLDEAKQGEQEYHAALSEFDFWLRSDGHRRNPGTTADFIGAVLLVGLREGWLEPPRTTKS